MLTQGNPVYSWKCARSCMCVGGTCTSEINALPIGSGKFQGYQRRR